MCCRTPFGSMESGKVLCKCHSGTVEVIWGLRKPLLFIGNYFDSFPITSTVLICSTDWLLRQCHYFCRTDFTPSEICSTEIVSFVRQMDLFDGFNLIVDVIGCRSSNFVRRILYLSNRFTNYFDTSRFVRQITTTSTYPFGGGGSVLSPYWDELINWKEHFALYCTSAR